MPEILINVINKIPQLSGDVRQITADNSDYTIRFVFDDGWGDGRKTVYFVREGGFVYPVGRTEEDTVTVPAVTDVHMRTALYIGVQQGGVRTSRPCMIPVYHAITDMIDDEAVQPDVSLWEDVVRRIESLEEHGGGSVSDEAIADAVDRYFDENPIEVPVKTSDLRNDSGFITKTASDLVNYYTKSQTYTQSEINALISAIPKFTISVVNSLPVSGISNTTVYLLSGGVSGNLYTEYIYVNGAWEILGSQRVDLDGYVTDEMLTQALQDYVKNTEFDTLAETVDTRMIPTYVLLEGEKPEDAPEWAVEVVDPDDDDSGGGSGGLTDEEKAEIVQAVIEALPKYNGEVEDV